MSTQVQQENFEAAPIQEKPRAQSGRIVTGVALVVIGLIAVLANFFDSPSFGILIVPTLGLIFLLWGIIVREVGLLIPGGILGGIGLGIYLNQGPFSYLEDTGEAGLFLLSFALGWALITLLSAFISDRVHWWPLIPGGVLAVIGGALMAGGLALEVLSWIGRFWPLGLVAVGLYLIIKRR